MAKRKIVANLSVDLAKDVLIFEIFSQSEPYEGLSNQEIRSLILGGRVNDFPANTPKQLAVFVMEKLWHIDPTKRPSMESALEWLSRYTGIKLQVGTLASSLPVVHQYFAAPVLKDNDYKDETKTANTGTKTRRLTVRKGSPKARTPRSKTPRGHSERVLANSAKSVKRAAMEDRARASKSKMQETPVADGRSHQVRPVPQLSPRKLGHLPREERQAEYENLVQFRDAVPQVTKVGEKSLIQAGTKGDEPALKNSISPFEKKAEKGENVCLAPVGSPPQYKSAEPAALQRSPSDGPEINEGPTQVEKKKPIEPPKKLSPSDEVKPKNRGTIEAPTLPEQGEGDPA
ncbi:hypothetical protein GCK32_007376 [Trichostrongylus colubriformis]|uniref:Serine-threonine/tyrosine-protein kinase catalytic domain-containing protein n=1 Tax=Trichostrongylus colubriformis TaxID=6319 RepID=A0AAN8FDI5_TRICO